MWNKIKNYNMVCGQCAMFSKGTGRWIGAFFLIWMLTVFLDRGPSETTLHAETFLLLSITSAMIINNFSSYGAGPNLIKRIPLTYKEDILYTLIWLPLCYLIFIAILLLLGAVGGCVNLILGGTTIDTIMAKITSCLNSPHYGVVYQVSLVLLVYGTFYPLSFTSGKRLFWTTTICFSGAIILYNIGMIFLLHGGIWNGNSFLSQLDQKPEGMWVSLLSLGISVLYAVGGTLTALKIHRPKRYDNLPLH